MSIHIAIHIQGKVRGSRLRIGGLRLGLECQGQGYNEKVALVLTFLLGVKVSVGQPNLGSWLGQESQGQGLRVKVRVGGPWLGLDGKKKIDKGIDFLRGWEKKIVSIFRLRSREEVVVSWDLNGAGPEIDT